MIEHAGILSSTGTAKPITQHSGSRRGENEKLKLILSYIVAQGQSRHLKPYFFESNKEIHSDRHIDGWMDGSPSTTVVLNL